MIQALITIGLKTMHRNIQQMSAQEKVGISKLSIFMHT